MRVQTIAGPFDRERLDRLKDTLREAENDGMTRDEVTMFEGWELLISFGQYLAEYVEGELNKKDHAGL